MHCARPPRKRLRPLLRLTMRMASGLSATLLCSPSMQPPPVVSYSMGANIYHLMTPHIMEQKLASCACNSLQPPQFNGWAKAHLLYYSRNLARCKCVAGSVSLQSSLARSAHTADLLGTRVVITGGILRDGASYVDVIVVDLAGMTIHRCAFPHKLCPCHPALTAVTLHPSVSSCHRAKEGPCYAWTSSC